MSYGREKVNVFDGHHAQLLLMFKTNDHFRPYSHINPPALVADEVTLFDRSSVFGRQLNARFLQMRSTTCVQGTFLIG